jgi:HSP20 family protein
MLIPWKPLRDLERFFEEWEPTFPEMTVVPRILRPSMDIYETEKEVVAEIEAPGVDPKKIKVSIEDNLLTVEGGEEKKEEEKKKGYYRKEIRKGYFKRVATLPVEVVSKKAKAVYRDGILKVTIPKAKPVKKKPEEIKIEVKAS